MLNRIGYVTLMSVLSVSASFAMHAEEPKAAVKLEKVKNRPSSPTIKVLIAKDLDGAQVEVKSAYSVFDPMTGKKLDSALTSSSYYMYPTTEGLKWGEEFPGIYQILIAPDRGTVLVSGIEYRGMVYAYQIDGALAFVNEVSIDDYADSILSAKVPPKITDKEVLAALAIAARTDALHKSLSAKATFFDIKAPASQYQGHGLSRKDLAFQETMNTTKNMVLTKGQPHEKVTGFEINWFEGNEFKAPVEKMEQLAKEGSDAKAILLTLFPATSITLAR